MVSTILDEDIRLLAAESSSTGVELSNEQQLMFATYIALLERWNTRINLTAARSRRTLVVQHLLDSLAIVPHLPERSSRIIDVGSGAGFPGAVVAIARPRVEVTALEPIHKKHAFLATLRRELQLANFHPLSERWQDHRNTTSFQPYDAAVSRATFALPVWLEYGKSLVCRGGTVLAMEGAKRSALPPSATRFPYTLPDLDTSQDGRSRAIILLRLSE